MQKLMDRDEQPKRGEEPDEDGDEPLRLARKQRGEPIELATKER
ncbi:MAG: hypothetical protein ACHQQS_07880 [Thermoanaerobaculales bacterium]